eukprot:5950533-Alexandrium_andersonii.AAC.1
MSASLVGSEMCIRDRRHPIRQTACYGDRPRRPAALRAHLRRRVLEEQVSLGSLRMVARTPPLRLQARASEGVRI